jgi:hypothetical protein
MILLFFSIPLSHSSIYCHSFCSQIIFGFCDFLELKRKAQILDGEIRIALRYGGKAKGLTTRSSLYASGHSLKLTKPIPIDHKQ